MTTASQKTDFQSKAAAQLAALGKRYSFVTIAERVGASEAAVRHASTGRRPASPGMREKLFELYAIPCADWDVPCTAVQPSFQAKSAHAETPAPVAGGSAKDRLDAILAGIEARLARASVDESVSEDEFTRMSQAATSAARALARVRGEMEITTATILRSGAWRQIYGALIEAVTPFPDVAAAIANALERLGDES